MEKMKTWVEILPCVWDMTTLPPDEIREEIREAFSGKLERFEGNLMQSTTIEKLKEWAAKNWVERRDYGGRIHWQRWV